MVLSIIRADIFLIARIIYKNYATHIRCGTTSV